MISTSGIYICYMCLSAWSCVCLCDCDCHYNSPYLQNLIKDLMKKCNKMIYIDCCKITLAHNKTISHYKYCVTPVSCYLCSQTYPLNKLFYHMVKCMELQSCPNCGDSIPDCSNTLHTVHLSYTAEEKNYSYNYN